MPTPFGGGGNACPNPVAPLDAITARAAQVGATVTFGQRVGPDAGGKPQRPRLTWLSCSPTPRRVSSPTRRTCRPGRKRRRADQRGRRGRQLPRRSRSSTRNGISRCAWLEQTVKSVVGPGLPGEPAGRCDTSPASYGDDDFVGRAAVLLHDVSRSRSPTPRPTLPAVSGDVLQRHARPADRHRRIRPVAPAEVPDRVQAGPPPALATAVPRSGTACPHRVRLRRRSGHGRGSRTAGAVDVATFIVTNTGPKLGTDTARST